MGLPMRPQFPLKYIRMFKRRDILKLINTDDNTQIFFLGYILRQVENVVGMLL